MSSPNWNDDDELMRDVRQAFRPEPVNQRILKAARAALSWLTIDADLELARVFYDSAVSAAGPVRGPGQESPRTLVFRGDDDQSLGVEIELSDTGIEGQIVPPGQGVVTLMTPSGTNASTETDEVGCFAFPAVLRGPIRLECALEARRFTTEWITV
jgi:hypothetical protein